MQSIILRTATQLVMPLLILFSIFLLLRGHNKPGGGFTGGLVAAAAFSLYALAYSTREARALVRIEPQKIIGLGLLLAIASGVFPMFFGKQFLTGMWRDLRIPLLGDLYLGTPVFFDIGVYLVVIGVTLIDVFSLAEEE